MSAPLNDLEFMREALQEAGLASKQGEVPVGAIIVLDGKVIARSHNEVEARKDATAHAELLALQRAASHLGNWRLNGAKLYVTLEPCPMCIGAMLLSRVDELYFGCADEVQGAAGSVFDLSDLEELPHRIRVRSGLLAEEAQKLLQSFFRLRRGGRVAEGA